MGIRKALKALWAKIAEPPSPYDSRGILRETDGAIIIPSPDGYHYADNHPWSADDQAKLVDDSWDTVDRFRKGELGPVPVWKP